MATLWDALKYGPIAVAALAAFWTAGLITIELRRERVRKDARRLLLTFMIFCAVLAGLAYGITAFDNASQRRNDASQRASNALIASELGGLDAEALSKYRRLAGDLDVSNGKRQFVYDSLDEICRHLTNIAKIAGTPPPGSCPQIRANR